jgi:hypothetical protein
MSVKPYDRCTMIMVNYVDLWLIHSHVAGLLDSARLELRELTACYTLLGACTSCPLLRSELEAIAVEIKDLKHIFSSYVGDGRRLGGHVAHEFWFLTTHDQKQEMVLQPHSPVT